MIPETADSEHSKTADVRTYIKRRETKTIQLEAAKAMRGEHTDFFKCLCLRFPAQT